MVGPTFQAVVIVPADSPAKTLADLKGGEVAFGDPASTSGTWVPRYQLLEAGLVSGRDYTLRVLGAHDAVALAVANHKVAAGGLSMPIYNRLLKEGKIDAKAVRVLAESPAIPEYMWTFREGLNQRSRRKSARHSSTSRSGGAEGVPRGSLHPLRELRCGPGAHLDRRDPGGQSRCRCGLPMTSKQLHPEIAAVLADGRRRLRNTLGALAGLSIVACAFLYAGAFDLHRYAELPTILQLAADALPPDFSRWPTGAAAVGNAFDEHCRNRAWRGRRLAAWCALRPQYRASGLGCGAGAPVSQRLALDPRIDLGRDLRRRGRLRPPAGRPGARLPLHRRARQILRRNRRTCRSRAGRCAAQPRCFPPRDFTLFVLPQILPRLVDATVYRWEHNLRAATTLGVVGAGGLGLEIVTAFHLFEYREASALIIVLIALVTVLNAAGAYVRARFLGGER